MLYIYLSALFLFIFVTYILLKKSNLKNQKLSFKFVIIIIVALVIISRIYRLDSLQGLDFDEAMGGINSWAISNYGVDFHLAHNPVYLYAWGSGMNALYPLLTVPFVKFLGLSTITYRLPMAFLGILSSILLIVSLIYAKLSNRKIAIYSLIILLSPGTIIPSRWAVESNIFPILFTFILSFFVFYCYTQSILIKRVCYYLIIFILSISAYAYSNNWLFLITFIVLFFSWGYKNKIISIKRIGISVVWFVLIDWPLAIFLYVNYISHKQLTVLGLTITKLAESRGNSQFIFKEGMNLPRAVLNNLSNTFSVLIQGNDGFLKNSIPSIGLFYPLMLTFALIGLIYFIGNSKNILDQFMFIMLISNVFTMMFIIPNFIHLNALTIPILYFESKGVVGALTSIKSIRIFSAIFLMLFFVFVYKYTYTYHQELANGNHENSLELQKMIKKSNPRKHRIYFVTGDATYSGLYTVVLFSHPINPYVFNNNANTRPAAFTSYTSFDNYYFSQELPQDIKGKSPILIVRNNVDLRNFMKVHKNYGVIKGEYYSYIKQK